MDSIIPTLGTLRKRQIALNATRDFFNQNNYIEVTTAALRKTAATDPYIDSFQLPDHENTLYLQSSPEYALKILMANHRVPLYEITAAYRQEISSPLHLNEFTLIEWYKPDADYMYLITETQNLIRQIASALNIKNFFPNTKKIPIDDFEIITVQDAFIKYAGFNPLPLNHKQLIDAALKAGTKVAPEWSWDDIFTCLIVDKIEPALGYRKPAFLIDYPPSQASLAKIRKNTIPIAERFELFVAGVELCNGYTELTDPKEQKIRFENDNKIRKNLRLPILPHDEMLIEALPKLGKLAGNALGFERLMLTLLDAEDIRQVTFTL